MKKNYENSQLIITISFLFIVLCLLFLLSLYKIRYRTYKVVDATVISDNYIRLIISDSNYKLLKSCTYLYIDNKKKKRDVISIERNVLKRGKIKYHDVIIRVKLDKYKENDYLKLTLYNNKERVINLFKICWR